MEKVALSISNPVSYLVASGVKWVENRSWSTDYRGRVFIHSSGDCLCDMLYERDLRGVDLKKSYAALEKYVDVAQDANADDIPEEEFERLIGDAVRRGVDDGLDEARDVMAFGEGMRRLNEFCDKFYARKDYKDLEDARRGALVKDRGYALTNFAIIGCADLVDVRRDCRSAWAEKGMYHWIFENPVLFKKPFENVKGKLRLWDCSHIVG